MGRLTLDEMVAQMSHGGAENNGQQEHVTVFTVTTVVFIIS